VKERVWKGKGGKGGGRGSRRKGKSGINKKEKGTQHLSRGRDREKEKQGVERAVTGRFKKK